MNILYSKESQGITRAETKVGKVYTTVSGCFSDYLLLRIGNAPASTTTPYFVALSSGIIKNPGTNARFVPVNCEVKVNEG